MAEALIDPPRGRAEWKKNLLAIFIGLLLVVVILGGLQVASYFWTQPRGEIPPPIIETASVPYLDSTTRTYGWQLLPSVQSQVKKAQGEKVIYEVTYKTDSWRRRVVFPEPDLTRKKFLIYLGCSNTFGQGLVDEETLDFQLSSRFPEYQSYNYGVPGWGLGHVLALAENEKFSEQIPQKTGLVIYSFPTYHVDRFFGGLQTIDWAGGLPYYRWESDHLVRRGFIHEERWLYARAARWWNQSFLRSQFHLAGPFARTRDELEIACKAVSEVKRRVTSQFEQAEFLLVLHPHSDGDDLTVCLDQYGVKWLDLRDLFRGHDRNLVNIEGDGHTNRFGNELLAQQIETQLKGQGY